jgi:two-component system, OmpR family, sensor histidine kinase CiaH
VFRSAALKLAGSYLAIIMLLSIGMSLALYNVSSNDIEYNVHHQIPYSVNQYLTPSQLQNLDILRDNQLATDRDHLKGNLVLFNFLVLVFGGMASYGLARRTLEPLEDSLEAQKRFTSDASHELRTPLAAIQAENEVALRDPSLTKTAAVDLLKSNLEEVGKLRALSEGLLHLARVNKNQPKFTTPIEIRPSVTDALDRLAKAAQAKKITIDNKTRNLTLKAEHHSLTELLVILLDNAIKYSPSGSKIRLSTSAKGKTGHITIQDKGAGIESKDLPHIFDRFYRVDASRSKNNTEGYGLGLAIAKKLADSMDGYITVKSISGSGSSFTISLPIA